MKYLTFIMRADNHGEGGILALLALVAKRRDGKPRIFVLTALGLFGAALLYGDGVITPAISVLSAVEGLAVKPIESVAAADSGGILEKLVVPITCVILVGLFWCRSAAPRASARSSGRRCSSGSSPSPRIGIPSIVQHPEVFAAVRPDVTP